MILVPEPEERVSWIVIGKESRLLEWKVLWVVMGCTND